jgi:two-component system chemotaxis sensor kinase CheA
LEGGWGMEYARILEDLIQKGVRIFKVELLLDVKAEFKSATAAKILKGLKEKYSVLFTLPDLSSDGLDEDNCEYRFFLEGDIVLQALKELMDGLVTNECGIDTYFIQEVLMDDIDAAVGIYNLEQVGNGKEMAYNDSVAGQEENKNTKADSVRIDIAKLNILSNLAAELVTCKAQVVQVLNMFKSLRVADKDIQAVIDFFEKGTSQLERISFDLQEQITQLRMFPIKTVFRKIPRIVRDLAVKCGKEIELDIKGEDTELDKTVLEQISDPLVHLVRNCVDHGIEAAEERTANGKPAKGRITIKAYTEGDIVYLEVEDDGRGIDVGKIKEKILENRLASKEEIEMMDEGQIMDYIFRPGFSTAETVSEISGRGVGMDVVRRNISLVKGNIKIESKKGYGTKFIIQIPLTVAIVKSLMVFACGRLYLVPIDKVVETFKVKTSNIRTVNNKKIVSWNGEIVPIFSLGEMLGLEAKYDDEHLYTVVVQYRSSKVGIIVNRLLGEQEAVVKPLDKYIGMVEGIMGATILGDGKVVLMLEPVGLIDRIAG